jgi:hypothetical protein
VNASNKEGPSSEARLLIPLKCLLAYGVPGPPTHTLLDYFQMSSTMARSCCRKFDNAIKVCYLEEHLNKSPHCRQHLQKTTLLLAETPSFFLWTEFLLKEMTTLIKEVKNKLSCNCGQQYKNNNEILTKFGQEKNCCLE